MFRGLSNIISINFTSLFNIENINSMEYMFANSRNLTFVNISNFNGINLSSIKFMFLYCGLLNSVDFSNFNAPELIYADSLFQECHYLEYVNFTNFNAPKLKYMRQMFFICISLKSLDLSSLSTEDDTILEETFYNCWAMKYLNLKNFKHKLRENLNNHILAGCYNLTYIDISSFTGEIPNIILLITETLPSEGEIVLKLDFYNLIRDQIPKGWNITLV